MEMSMEQNKDTEHVERKKGGYRTMPFIIANETFEKVANVGLHVNMVLYLLNEYHAEPSTAAIIIFLWNAGSNFMPLFGALLSDSCLGRFRVIAWGTIIDLLGLIVLWLTAIIRHARPPECNNGESCTSATGMQFLFLFSSLALMAFGAGGIRPCSLAFAADQINNPKNPKNERIMKSFFNWYYVSVGVSVMVSMVFIVYIQVKAGWVIGFGIPVGLMLFSSVVFFLGSFMYVKVKPNKSLLAGFAQVIVASWKNRHLTLPPNNSGLWYFQSGSNLVQPTDKARFLNKACIMKNREKDLDSNGMPIDPWSLCTVRQVEELKAVIKVLPLWSTGITIAVTISQQSFSVVQATTMNRMVHNFEIPPTSFSAFGILTLTIWVAIYDRIIVSLLSKYTKKGKGLTLKQRMGIGIGISCLATLVAALVEKKRRNEAIREGFINDPKGVVNMSAMWLVPQHCLVGLAEAFSAIGQIEFFYSQFPKSMSSIAVSLFTLGFGTGNLVATIIVKSVKNGTQRGGQVSWLSANINQGHYDYYYWLLTILSLVNMFYFLLCSWAYGSTEDIKNWDEEVDTKSEMSKYEEENI
ncbi:putative proton-dependent oligopeptide transporter family, major facilitator superfamily [Medicago truncatula]|uniref:Peptide/nitrate transporter plant n=1 Tax=Medicago truncatula TaxID=3880 RepID=A0A072TW44_MEDTR|nr:protein NRT1/ PTR FAMILY 1.1 [Medicago truncatula]XP_024628448.1 protein NRT1/ PTR FAMILY 1.1 [Medicago truncatula]XP_039685582.1 protein NRT1/ PTR FAMILY 1.1 [Medicago truncatula]KEH21351.1 peptide/nitrate transporter plant [Medicago truncatula]RHN43664.1 putative proton-dependent oligopeptide transporter family, major facilitator superfamily [Medicago truncatula]